MSQKIISVFKRCNFCGDEFEIKVPENGYRLWQAGTAIQKALPNITIDEAELLISGTCKVCWDTWFSDPAYQEEEEKEDIYPYPD